MVIAGALALFLVMVSGYQRLVTLEDAVDSAWSQVENAYQRRSALVAELARDRDVLEARSRTEALYSDRHRVPPSAAQFAEDQNAQDALSNAISAHPKLVTKLEGIESDILTERVHYNELAAAFDAERRRFSTAIVTKLLSDRFGERPLFKARARSESPPQVSLP
jgi:LemA protein